MWKWSWRRASIPLWGVSCQWLWELLSVVLNWLNFFGENNIPRVEAASETGRCGAVAVLKDQRALTEISFAMSVMRTWHIWGRRSACCHNETELVLAHFNRVEFRSSLQTKAFTAQHFPLPDSLSSRQGPWVSPAPPLALVLKPTERGCFPFLTLSSHCLSFSRCPFRRNVHLGQCQCQSSQTCSAALHYMIHWHQTCSYF